MQCTHQFHSPCSRHGLTTNTMALITSGCAVRPQVLVTCAGAGSTSFDKLRFSHVLIDEAGQVGVHSRLIAAVPMENPYCSCKLGRKGTPVHSSLLSTTQDHSPSHTHSESKQAHTHTYTAQAANTQHPSTHT